MPNLGAALGIREREDLSGESARTRRLHGISWASYEVPRNENEAIPIMVCKQCLLLDRLLVCCEWHHLIPLRLMENDSGQLELASLLIWDGTMQK